MTFTLLPPMSTMRTLIGPRSQQGDAFQRTIEHGLDEIGHAGSGIARGHAGRLFLERGESVGHGDGKSADFEECVVVLRVADTDDFLRGKLKMLQRRPEACCLVDSRGRIITAPLLKMT